MRAIVLHILQVYNRIVAVAWLHLLGAIAMVVLAAITGIGFDWAPQFSTAGVGLTLSLLLFFKVSTERPLLGSTGYPILCVLTKACSDGP